MTHIEPGFYVFDARAYLTFEAAYTAGDYRRFDHIEEATAHAQRRDLEIIRVSVRPAAQEVA